MSILLDNKILSAAEQKIAGQLTPPNRADYMKVVVSGMKAGLAKGPDGILASLKDSKDPIHDCVNGAINLCLLLKKQSRDTMPFKALVPAALTLTFKGMDFAEKMGLIKIGNAEVAQATRLFANTIFQRLGIKPSMLQTAASKLHSIAQDPAQMDKINMASGAAKHPLASIPTPLPEE